MADGDQMLDEEGNRMLDEDGNRSLDDGAGCPECCTVAAPCWYEIKKCLDDTNAGIWVQLGAAVAGVCPPLDIDLAYQAADGVTCYYVPVGASGTTTAHSDPGLDLIFSCADCGVTFGACFGCEPAGCVVKSVTYNVTGNSIGPQCCPGDASFQFGHSMVLNAGAFNGSHKLGRAINPLAPADKCYFKFSKAIGKIIRDGTNTDPVTDCTFDTIVADWDGTLFISETTAPFPSLNDFAIEFAGGSFIKGQPSIDSVTGTKCGGLVETLGPHGTCDENQAVFGIYFAGGSGTVTITAQLKCPGGP